MLRYRGDNARKTSAVLYTAKQRPSFVASTELAQGLGVVYVALGGAIGATARYLVSNWMAAWIGTGFPWGTFFANVSGSFLIGVFFVLAEAGNLPAEARLLVAVGVLGGYTTFSSFSYESLKLLTEGALLPAFLNMFGQLALGLVFVYLGVVLGRFLAGI